MKDYQDSNNMYKFLLVLTIASTVGLQGWRTLFNNFAVEVANINGYQVGIIQSVREVPGFLAFLAIYVILLLKEHRLSCVSIILLGVGVAATGFFPSFLGLILTTFIMSLGFHYFETTNQSLTLQYFTKTEAPLVLGKLRSYASLANIAIGAITWALLLFLSYQNIFLIIGGSVILMGVWGLLQDPERKDLPIQHKKMILKKRYWLFYVLTLLAGARRQIFIVFSVFLMVKNFHYDVKIVALLFTLNNLINFFLSPLIGKWINKFGERKVLSIEYFSLIFVFLFYAYSNSPYVIAILYILDHIFFNFAMAIRTYFQKIADPKDIAPSMAVGFTINHIAAVIVPIIGGFLWMIDYKIPFIGGAFLSLLSFIFTQMIKTDIC